MSRRKLKVNRKINSYEEFEASYQDCDDVKFRTRMLAVLQTWGGKPSLEVAKDIHMSQAHGREWVHRYYE